ncbi:MAG: GNAT family N-acetyltransferase [Chthoniobacterales bacterium]
MKRRCQSVNTLPSNWTLPFPGGVARVVECSALKEAEPWRTAFARYAKDHRFYEIVEETLDGRFEHHYLVLEDQAAQVRAVQPLFFLRQNLIEGVPALRGAVEFIRRRFPRFMTMRALMIGCAAGEGHLGVCHPGDEEWAAAALRSVLVRLARSGRASLIVFKDFGASYRGALHPLCANGYARVASMPMTRLSLRYRDFDEYFGTLSRAARKDLRRKFRKAENAAPIQLEVATDVRLMIDELYPLYSQVHERSHLKFETLTKDYFSEIGRRMPDRARFFIWRKDSRLIAFSLCLVHNGAIYDECLGLDYSIALDLHLYFYTLRDIISWALEHGLTSYCSGPLNYEPKLHLDCELAPLDLYVMHTSPWLNPIFRRALKFLQPTRHDRVLRRFPNASEL